MQYFHFSVELKPYKLFFLNEKSMTVFLCLQYASENVLCKLAVLLVRLCGSFKSVLVVPNKFLSSEKEIFFVK